MDIEEKSFTTEWTPIEKEGNPKKAGKYIVTRQKPTMTTTAFFEYGEWWDGPLHEWAWPEGMIVAWQPMPASTVYRQRKAASQDMGLTIPEQRRQRERRGYQHEHNTGICHTLRKSRLL